MNYSFLKKCLKEKCGHKVWDACIANLHCMEHCMCPENNEIKKDEREILLANQQDHIWKLLIRNRYSRKAR